MPSETRPTVGGLTVEQRTLAKAHWYTWLCDVLAQAAPRPAGEQAAYHEALLTMERRMQPKTLHQLALARDRFWKEKAQTRCTNY